MVSPDGDCLSGSIFNALEHEFPNLRVDCVEDFASASTRFSRPIALVLVDMDLFVGLEEAAAGIAKWHPDALVAMLQSGCHPEVDVRQVVASPLVRGVLPMNLKLDLWLAAVRLMLLGGEYYPSAILKAVSAEAARPVIEVLPRLQVGRKDARTAFGNLTSREMQILELVAQGSQNKIIATRLDLSEHTVKVHLHNIIAKLGATNRTEAARRYFDVFSGSGPQPSPGFVP